MYPDFHYLFQSLFGVDIPQLAILKTFGFFVAMAFLAGAYVLSKELERKKDQGYFKPEIVTEEVGKPLSANQIVIFGVIAFIIGYKFIGLLQNASQLADPMSYLFSAKGSLIGGLVIGVIALILKYTSHKKTVLPKPVKKQYQIFPHQRVADIIFIAAIAGFAGAKIFNAFETWDSFVQDPIQSLISSSGLTFYGGLICATAALYYYSRRKKFSFKHLCDAAAPALILAYGIGRLGCHFAGDGDWGIYNSAYVTQADGNLIEAMPETFNQTILQYPAAFTEFAAPEQVPHKYVTAPSFLPVWMVAMNYKHNVNNEGIVIAGDESAYNHVLAASVFPTPIYEFFACLIIFVFLWAIRKRFTFPLQMFGLYLIFNGLERFFVEKIRVNYKYDWGFIHPTQAEIISFGLVVAGLLLLIKSSKFSKKVST